MGRALIQKGMYREAIETLKKGMLLAGEAPNILGALGQAYGLAGETESARTALAQLHLLKQRRPVRFACFALVHLGLGEKQEALTWLERATEVHESSISAIGVHPVWDPLREEPRFQELLKRAGAGPFYR
jgi:serine/threonine-protein kinase